MRDPRRSRGLADRLALRADGGRLSLESLLSAGALWLTLAFLLESPVEAQQEGYARSAARGQPDPSPWPGGGGPGAGNGDPAAVRLAGEDEGEALGGAVGEGRATFSLQPLPALAGIQGGGGRSGSALAALPLLPPLPSLKPVATDAIPPPRLSRLAAAGGPAPGALRGPASPGGLLPRRDPPSGPVGAGLISVPAEPPGPSGPAQPWLPMPLVPPPPRLSLWLLGNQEAVARSLAGDAAAGVAGTQAGLRHTLIDLRDAPPTDLTIGSRRERRVVAYSLGQGVALGSEGSHGALVESRIEGGAAQGSYAVSAEESLDLVLGGGDDGGDGMAPQLAVRQRLSALEASRLRDSGGGDPIRIEARLELTLQSPGQSPGGLPAPEGLVAADVAALRQSSIVLGDRGSEVAIHSRLVLSGLPAIGTVVGLDDSELQSGGGDDSVTITAAVEGGAGPHAVALDRARIQLGGGQDRLRLEGAVRHSRIETGSGSTRWQMKGPIEASVLLVPTASAVDAVLGDEAVELQVLGHGQVSLRAGGSADRFRLDDTLQGWLDGGGGVDRLVLEPGALAQESRTREERLVLEGPGQGALAGLRFEGIEEVVLPSPRRDVRLTPEGALSGGLRTGEGSRLDYSAWRDAVMVDLREGRATAFAAGAAGGIDGVEEVLGGEAEDHLVAGSTTRRLLGGPGDDWLELSDWFGFDGRPGAALVGGAGQDLFVLPPLGSASSAALRSPAALLDLQRLPSPRLALSDRLAQWQPSALRPGSEELVVLQPSGLEALGDPRLLPLAPLEQLLAGMGDHAPQLAIATGRNGSELVRLDSGSSYQSLLDLPALQLDAERPSAPPLLTAIG